MSVVAAHTPLVVVIRREPESDFFELFFQDGSTELIESTELVEWFRLRHADRMDVNIIERAIDDAWNFGEATVVIKNARQPQVEVTRTTPRI